MSGAICEQWFFKPRIERIFTNGERLGRRISLAGLTIGHELSNNSAPTNGKCLKQRLSILGGVTAGKLKGIATDRGFDSKSMLESLEEKDLFYGICPKNPRDLAERVAGDEKFVKK